MEEYKTNLKYMTCKDVDSFQLAQDRTNDGMFSLSNELSISRQEGGFLDHNSNSQLSRFPCRVVSLKSTDVSEEQIPLILKFPKYNLNEINKSIHPFTLISDI
jgi:hypothetical protein